MYEQIMNVDDKLPKLKYKQSKGKKGLYSKRMCRGQIYLDYRDVGGKSIEEQVNEGPLCYSYPYNRNISRESAWESNRDFMKE